MGPDLLEAHLLGVGWRDSVSVGCWISVDDSAAICTEIDAAVDSRIAGDGAVGECVLVLIVVDSHPGKSGIVGAVDAPNPKHLGTAIERWVFVETCIEHTETNCAGGRDVPQLEECGAAVNRMPDAVRGCCASAREPDVALVARRCLKLRGRACRRKIACGGSGKGLPAVGTDVEGTIGKCVELPVDSHGRNGRARAGRRSGGRSPGRPLVCREEHSQVRSSTRLDYHRRQQQLFSTRRA